MKSVIVVSVGFAMCLSACVSNLTLNSKDACTKFANSDGIVLEVALPKRYLNGMELPGNPNQTLRMGPRNLNAKITDNDTTVEIYPVLVWDDSVEMSYIINNSEHKVIQKWNEWTDIDSNSGFKIKVTKVK